MIHISSKQNIKYLSLIGALDFETIRPLVERMDAIRNDRSVTQITLTINSTGGGFYSAFGLFDYLTAYPKPVDIIASGSCQSSAVALLQAGRKRFAHPHTFFWLHEGKYTIQEYKTIGLLNIDLKDFERQEETLLEILSKKAKVSKEKIKALCGSEHGFGATEALNLGLIDSVWPDR